MLAGTSGSGRLRLTEHFHWYSPGLELNDLGYLKQADLLANQLFLGWAEPTPRGIFRAYSAQFAREDKWDFGGLHTNATTSLDASGSFTNKWSANGRLAFDQTIDTRALRGGPALRWHDYSTASLGAGTDSSHRAALSVSGEHSWATDGNASSSNATGTPAAASRPAPLVLGGAAVPEAPRWPAVRHDGGERRGSPLAAGSDRPGHLELHAPGRPHPDARPDRPALRQPVHQHRALHGLQARDRHAGPRLRRPLPRLRSRRDRLPAGLECLRRERVRRPELLVREPGLQLPSVRSNLVVRWEYRPGSVVYAVWSHGRTDPRDRWQQSFGRNWKGSGTRARRTCSWSSSATGSHPSSAFHRAPWAKRCPRWRACQGSFASHSARAATNRSDSS